jgi:siroheme synthase
MGVTSLPDFTRRLIKGGMDDTTPAAIIQEGTTPRQRIVYGTVANIAERASQAGLTAPALTVIGRVVEVSETLRWFQGNTTPNKVFNTLD